MIIGSSSSKTSATTSHHCPSSSSSATSSQACAACKYQRRRCNPDCTLAPYFPANQQLQFLNAHRLFGVCNILKIIRHLDPVQRADAMRSIIFQSNARAHDPIGGCYRIIRELERQLQRDSAELALVRRQLAICQARSQAQAALSPTTTALADPNLLDLNPPDDDGGGGGGGDGATYDNYLVQPMHYDGDGGSDHVDDGRADNIIISNTDSPGIIGWELPAPPLQSLKGRQEQPQCVVDEQEVKPLVDMFDIRKDIATGDDDESSKNNAANNTSSFPQHENEPKEDPNMI